ncbi:unnamed protein product [Acanthosepion pharaonis]|uniref:Uncharacterized protein n=1 Tax=Acanthosepion pharaonis TaxID=158019 RepID=A0A812EXX6_ACAPH|nr:unnamed protein product [Sepia pharaonis]
MWNINHRTSLPSKNIGRVCFVSGPDAVAGSEVRSRDEPLGFPISITLPLSLSYHFLISKSLSFVLPLFSLSQSLPISFRLLPYSSLSRPFLIYFPLSLSFTLLIPQSFSFPPLLLRLFLSLPFFICSNSLLLIYLPYLSLPHAFLLCQFVFFFSTLLFPSNFSNRFLSIYLPVFSSVSRPTRPFSLSLPLSFLSLPLVLLISLSVSATNPFLQSLNLFEATM